MAMGSQFHKVEPMLGERDATDSPLPGLGPLKTVQIVVGPEMSK